MSSPTSLKSISWLFISLPPQNALPLYTDLQFAMFHFYFPCSVRFIGRKGRDPPSLPGLNPIQPAVFHRPVSLLFQELHPGASDVDFICNLQSSRFMVLIDKRSIADWQHE
ncbi:hypothetical protein BCO26_0794 [Heyndrickxia coagulans 2-6]|nr:hypothetical protein BCO26_0794 [Heyndrickxia coagulans 2-6]